MAKEKTKLKAVNDKLYADTARELNLPVKLVKDVILNGQAKFTAHIMSNNTFDGIRWPFFGVFKAKHKVVQVLSYMKGLDPAQRKFFRAMRRLQAKQKYL